MKTIYLVRHGESDINVSPTWLADDPPGLTQRGKEQAQAIAARVAKLPIDLVLTSTMRRTIETAEIIFERLGNIPTETWETLNERRTPSEMIGRSKTDPEALEKMKLYHRSFIQNGLRMSDGTNFDDIHRAALAVLAALEKRSEEHILIVGHGFTSKMIVATLLWGESLTAEQFEPFVWGMRTKNTGLTVLHHNPEDPHRSWWISTWNDHAHLA
jgi:probable phosphoglycerate mutase